MYFMNIQHAVNPVLMVEDANDVILGGLLASPRDISSVLQFGVKYCPGLRVFGSDQSCFCGRSLASKGQSLRNT